MPIIDEEMKRDIAEAEARAKQKSNVDEEMKRDIAEAEARATGQAITSDDPIFGEKDSSIEMTPIDVPVETDLAPKHIDQVGTITFTPSQWEERLKKIKEAEDVSSVKGEQEYKTKYKRYRIPLTSGVDPEEIDMPVPAWTEEDREDWLKSLASSEKSSLLRAALEPAIVGAMEEYEKNKESGLLGIPTNIESIITGAAGGLKKSLTGKTGQEPITLKELEKFSKTDEKGNKVLDVNILGRTHLPVPEFIKDYSSHLLSSIGKDQDPQAIKELESLINIRGSLHLKDPKARGVSLLKDFMDAIAFNIPSAVKFQEEINKSSLLKRPEGMKSLGSSAIVDAQKHIAQAAKEGRPVEWKSPYGKIEIPPDSTIETVEDKVFAHRVLQQVVRLSDFTIHGGVQDVGAILNQIATGAVTGKVASVIAKAVPASFPSWFIKWAAVPVDIATQAKLGELGTPGTKEDKDAAFYLNGLIAGLFNVTALGVDSALVKATNARHASPMKKWIKEFNETGVEPEPMKRIDGARDHTELPPELGIDEEAFKVQKQLLDNYNASRGRLGRNINAYGVKYGVDLRAPEHFRQFLADDSSEAKIIREDLSMLDVMSNDKDMESTRNEMALRHVLAEATAAKPLPASPRLPGTVIEPRRQRVLEQARDYLGSTKATHDFLVANYPEYESAFWQKINSNLFNAADFYNISTQGVLNRSLEASKRNMDASGKAFQQGAVVERVMTERFKTADKLTPSGDIEASPDVSTKLTGIQNKIVSAKKAKMVSVDNLKETILEFLQQNGAKAPQVAKSLVNAFEDIQGGSHINKQYMKKMIEAYSAAGGTNPAFVSSLRQVIAKDLAINRGTRELGNFAREVNAIDQQKIITNKIRNLGTDADRVMNNLIHNENNPEAASRILSHTIFDGKTPPKDIVPLVESVTKDKIPARKSVKDVISELDKELLPIDGEQKYSKKEMSSIRKFKRALESYESDLEHYNKSNVVINSKESSLPVKLTSLRSAIDQTKNPTMVKELHAKMQQIKTEFNHFVESRNMDMTDVEIDNVWKYITGDAYARLKLGANNFADLNEGMLDSIFKFYNKSGRHILDEYAKVHFDKFGTPLDKNAFHAFYATPANLFDGNGVVRNAFLRAEMNYKYNKMQFIGQEAMRYAMSLKSVDAMEAAISQHLRLSSGAYFSYLNDDIRVAKKLVRDIMAGMSTDPEFPKLNILKDLKNSEFYAYMENPTLVNMIKKSFVADGYKENFNIYEFHQDGTTTFTSFGEFLSDLYSDKKQLDIYFKNLNDAPEYIDNVKADIYNKAMESDLYVDKPDLSPEENMVQRERHSKLVSEYVSSYWNFFDRKDSARMFDLNKKFITFSGKIDAAIFEITNKIIRRQNAIYKKLGGAEVAELKWRKHRIMNSRSAKDNDIFTGPFDALYEDIADNPLYGTSEYGIAANASSYRLESIKSPLDNLLHGVGTGLISAGTIHSRSGLTAVAVNADILGFQNYAKWVADVAGLVPGSSLAVNPYPFAAFFRAAKTSLNWSSIITTPLAVIGNNLTRAVSPFIKLLSPRSLIINNMQAHAAMWIKSNKTLSKAANVLLATVNWMPRIIALDRFGKPRELVKFWRNVDVADYKVGIDILKKGQDIVFLNRVMADSQYARAGKVAGVPFKRNLEKLLTSEKGAADLGDFANQAVLRFDENIGKITDAWTNFSSENVKERFEMGQRSVAMQEGLNVHQALKEAFADGDEQNAAAILQGAFPNRSEADIQWHLNNYARAAKDGDMSGALYGFLPAYIDQNIGRFGRAAQPLFVRKLAGVLPGAGLFYASKNMMTWHYIQLMQNAANPYEAEKAKMAAVLANNLAHSQLVNLAYTAMGTGLAVPIASLFMSEETKRNMRDPAHQNDIDVVVAKLALHGITPGIDYSKAAGLSLRPAEFKEKVSNYKWWLQQVAELLGIDSRTPVFGYAFDKIMPMFSQLKLANDLGSLIPEMLQGDTTGVIKLNVDTEQKFLDVLERLKIDPASPTAKEELQKAIAYMQTTVWPKVVDNFIGISPVGFVSDVLGSYYVMQSIYNEYKKAHVDIQREGQQLLETSMKDRETIAPLANIGKTYVPGVDKLLTDFYKKTGFIKDENVLDFAGFLDSLYAIYVHNGVIDDAFATRLRDNNLKYHKLMGGDERKEEGQEADSITGVEIPIEELSRIAIEAFRSGTGSKMPGVQKSNPAAPRSFK